MKNLLLALFASVVVAFCIYVAGFPNGLFLDTEVRKPQGWTIGLAVVAMLVGVIAGRMHTKLTGLDSFKPKVFLRGLWRDSELWKSLLAAPIVFGVVYSLLAQSHDLVLSTIFSFQNGFFCNAILTKKQAEVAATGVVGPPAGG